MGAREGAWGCTQGGGMHPEPPDPAPAMIPPTPRRGLSLSQAQGVWSGDCTPECNLWDWVLFMGGMGSGTGILGGLG